MSIPKEIPFTDTYGDDRVIHRATNGGLAVKRIGTSPILALNAEVSRHVGQRVKALRIERGWTLVELATRIGAGTGNPKHRMWALDGGMRLGTVYALAIALGVEVQRKDGPAQSGIAGTTASDQPPAGYAAALPSDSDIDDHWPRRSRAPRWLNGFRRWLLRHTWAIRGPLGQLMRGPWYPMPDDFSDFTDSEMDSYLEWIGFAGEARASRAETERRNKA